MDGVLNAIQVVLSIFVVIGVGMFLTHIGWIGTGEAKLLSKLVVRVALPATIVSNIFGKFTGDSLIGMAAGVIVPALSISISMVLARLVARLTRVPANRKGAFTTMFAFSNTVFIGLPVCKALFGEEAVPFTLIYYIANTMLFWTLGYSLMRKDGGAEARVKRFRDIPRYLFSRDKSDPAFAPAKNALEFLSKLVPIPLIFLIVSAVLVLLGVKLPSFLMSAASQIGGTVTPLSLIYTGYVLMRMFKEGHFRWENSYIALAIGRFIVSPLLVMLLVTLFRLNLTMKELLTPVMAATFIAEAAMPVMSQTSIVAAGCGGDDEFCAGNTAFTTLLSLVFIPLYMYVISVFFA